MNTNTWRFERITESADSVQHWKTVGLANYGLPELGIHIHPLQNRDEMLQILKGVALASLEGLKVADGQMFYGFHRYPLFTFRSMTLDFKEYSQIVIADDWGQYPWDPNCKTEYKHQISFITDKVFYLVTQNKYQVNCLRKSIALRQITPKFKKRADGYVYPFQFIVNNELFQTGHRGTCRSLGEYLNEVKFDTGLNDLSVICKDTDYSDPINKHFKDYKEKHLDH